MLAQFRGDPRTVALLLGAPPALATLLWLVLDHEVKFARVGPQLVAIFPFTTMFLVTSITMLRERTSGTLGDRRRPVHEGICSGATSWRSSGSPPRCRR